MRRVLFVHFILMGLANNNVLICSVWCVCVHDKSSRGQSHEESASSRARVCCFLHFSSVSRMQDRQVSDRKGSPLAM